MRGLLIAVLVIAVLVVGVLLYRSRKSGGGLNVERDAQEQIEKAKRR